MDTAKICELRDALGAKLMAYVAGVQSTTNVRAWAEGQQEPTGTILARLDVVSEIMRWANRDSAGVFQAWMMGMNPLLGDNAPACMIRSAMTEAQLESVRTRVVNAAYVHLAHD